MSKFLSTKLNINFDTGEPITELFNVVKKFSNKLEFLKIDKTKQIVNNSSTAESSPTTPPSVLSILLKIFVVFKILRSILFNIQIIMLSKI